MEHPHIRGLSGWRLLSRGASSAVWEAHQTSLERLVAVKVYERELGEADQRRFLREATAVGRLSGHRSIVTTHDAGVLPDDRPYLVVGLCPGGSLERWLEPGSRPGEEQVRRVGVRIADALAAAHACGVLHGDVQPAHILLDEYGSPRLADFGLAAITGMEAEQGTALRVSPAYAAPEALRRQPATEAGDVYSLAATLYALLAGRPPRPVTPAGVTPEQLVELARRPIAPISAVNWFLMDVLMTALAEDPAARPTARELRDQLAAITLDPAPRRAHGKPTRGAAAPRQKNRRDALLALALALVVLLGAAAVWIVEEPGPSGARPAASRDESSGSARPDAGASEGSAAAGVIELEPPTTSAEPFEAVRIEGRHQARAGTFLRVQRWERGGWRDFPLPTRTNASGNFTAHVEFSQPGRYQVRVVDPASGATSEPVDLQIVAA